MREAPSETNVSVLPTKDVGDNKIRTMTTVPEQESWPSIDVHFQRALPDIALRTVPSEGTAGNPNLPSDQPLAELSPDPTDEWIIVDQSQTRSYTCGYLGCDMNYFKRHHLIRHLVMHTGTSGFRCPYPKCVGRGFGKEYFRDSSMLRRHMVTYSLAAFPAQKM